MHYSADILGSYEDLFKEAHAVLTKEAFTARARQFLLERLTAGGRAARRLRQEAQAVGGGETRAEADKLWKSMLEEGKRESAQAAQAARRAPADRAVAQLNRELTPAGARSAAEAAPGAAATTGAAEAAAGRQAGQAAAARGGPARGVQVDPAYAAEAEAATQAARGGAPAAAAAPAAEAAVAEGGRQGLHPALGAALGLGGAGLGAAGMYGYGRHKEQQAAEAAEEQRKRTRNIAFGSGLAAGVVAPHVIGGLGRVARGMSGTGLFPAFQGGGGMYR